MGISKPWGRNNVFTFKTPIRALRKLFPWTLNAWQIDQIVRHLWFLLNMCTASWENLGPNHSEVHVPRVVSKTKYMNYSRAFHILNSKPCRHFHILSLSLTDINCMIHFPAWPYFGRLSAMSSPHPSISNTSKRQSKKKQELMINCLITERTSPQKRLELRIISC